jgi:hypothetical protein
VGSRQLDVGVDANFRAATKAHVAFSTRDMDAPYGALEKADMECVWDEALGGARRFCANDPWGNRLEFTEPTSRVAK